MVGLPGNFGRNRGFLPILLLLTVFLLALVKGNMVTAGLGLAEPTWTRNLPSDICYNLDHPNCHLGSPVAAWIDADDKKDLVAVTNNGHVVVVRHDGQLLWDTDVAPFFGMAPGTQEISSSPAVADIDNDGFPEIAVGVGTIYGSICTQGGFIVLNHLGQVEPGWPFLSVDDGIPPEGCRDSIVSSPSIGDMDNDGDLEIVAAGFDKRIYAWHHDGTLMDGFPPASAHSERFPTWEGFRGKLGDTIWSSPALADLDNDGYLDVIIGTDEGNFDQRYGGDSGGWTCPYALPAGWSEGYCGGSIYSFDRFGNTLPNFPIYVLETVVSSPAISDANGDGELEIFIGSGNFYYHNSPDHPTFGFRLFGFDSRGAALQGWEGGKVTGGSVVVSPSIGDIAGDTAPEIIVLAGDRKLYAWHFDGSPVNGFPMSPLDYIGTAGSDFGGINGISLADYDSDGKMEIIFAQGWTISIVDGDGRQLTATDVPNNTLPVYSGQGLVINTPAVDDIDGDGKLELIVTNSKMFVWDLDQSSETVDWPVFKGNTARTSVYPQPKLKVSQTEITIMHQSGDPPPASTVFTMGNSGGRSFQWTVSSPPEISVTPSSGVMDESGSISLSVSVDPEGMPDGVYALGNIVFEATIGRGFVINGTGSIPVRLVIGDISRVYTPHLER